MDQAKEKNELKANEAVDGAIPKETGQKRSAVKDVCEGRNAKEVRKEKEDSGLKCPFCNRVMKDLNSFKIHMINDHEANAQLKNSVEQPADQTKIKKCPWCQKFIAGEKQLRNHIGSVHPEHGEDDIVVVDEQSKENETIDLLQDWENGEDEILQEVDPLTNVVHDVVEDDSNENYYVDETVEDNEKINDKAEESNKDKENEATIVKQCDAVMVKGTKHYWPGKVLSVDDHEISVEMFGTGEIKTVALDKCKAFSVVTTHK